MSGLDLTPRGTKSGQICWKSTMRPLSRKCHTFWPENWTNNFTGSKARSMDFHQISLRGWSKNTARKVMKCKSKLFQVETDLTKFLGMILIRNSHIAPSQKRNSKISISSKFWWRINRSITTRDFWMPMFLPMTKTQAHQTFSQGSVYMTIRGRGSKNHRYFSRLKTCFNICQWRSESSMSLWSSHASIEMAAEKWSSGSMKAGFSETWRWIVPNGCWSPCY